MKRYYVDHNATTPMLPSALATLCEVSSGVGNAGSTHHEGQACRVLVEESRRRVAKRLGVVGGRVVFTSGATEANNLVIASLEGPLLTSRLEHASVVAPVERRASEGGALVWLGNDEDGVIDIDDACERVASGEVRAVALMAANNELGTITGLETLALRCVQHRVWLHVDAVQAFARTPWTVPSGVSSVTVSAHKIGGPQGVGALWLADGFATQDHAAVRPLVVGGHQERGLRAGTENVAGIASFGVAARDADTAAWSALASVRDRFEARVAAAGGVVNGARAPRIPNTSNVSLPGVDAEELLMALDLEGVACSAGSACFAGSTDPSPVIAALGLDAARTQSALRFSFGPEHSADDADEVAARVVRVFERCLAVRS